MRYTKQKRHRKTIKYYTACFGFREPFKVLCDGTFVHHLVANHLSPDSSLSTTLGSPVQLFTSKCVIEELKSLGSSHVKSFDAARKEYRFARCEHDEKVSAMDCIMEIIGEKNPEHFFVATQDIELRKKCREIPGVPVIFGLRNALFLEQLSTFQRDFVKAAEEERLHMTDSEYKLLQKRVKNIRKADEAKDSSAGDEENGEDESGHQVFENKKAPRRGMDVKDKAQFKRKRAKGPNPLSCKKKKITNSSAPNSGKNEKAGGETGDAQRNRLRKRKRTRKAKTSLATDGANN